MCKTNRMGESTSLTKAGPAEINPPQERVVYVDRSLDLADVFSLIRDLMAEFESVGFSVEKMAKRILTVPVDFFKTLLEDTLNGSPVMAGLSRHLSPDEEAALLAWIDTLEVVEVYEAKEVDPNTLVHVTVDADGLGVAGIELMSIRVRAGDVLNPTIKLNS